MKSAIIMVCVAATLGAVAAACGTGEGPETVVVPVGEPSADGSDPYDDQGDLACGSETGAVSARVLDTPNLEVLMTFVGTEEIWVFRLTVAEFEAAQFNLEEIFSEAEMLGMTQEEVDELQGEVCAPAGARTKTGERIVTALVDAMGDKVWDMRKTACEE